MHFAKASSQHSARLASPAYGFISRLDFTRDTVIETRVIIVIIACE